MCKNCGCSGGHHHHHDGHGGDHVHHDEHGQAYTHRHDVTETVTLGEAVLAANYAAAEKNRAYFRQRKILALNLISSPGSGKTTLLERTLRTLAEKRVPCAVIVGDQYGELDADRMRKTGVPVTQIQTGESCHLNAEQIGKLLDSAIPAGTRVLFIENIGNLVCPTAFDLGEAEKVALLSTPEGEEKPLKYPALFAAANLVLLTKTDLAEVLGYNREECIRNIRHINPDARIIELSARTGKGMEQWIDRLLEMDKESAK